MQTLMYLAPHRLEWREVPEQSPKRRGRRSFL
jgi:hypothetical protein